MFIRASVGRFFVLSFIFLGLQALSRGFYNSANIKSNNSNDTYISHTLRIGDYDFT